jgi:glycosyltransferase involved in cell wall biosynthesis
VTGAGPRVLLVSAEYAPTPGGVGDYTARLADALASAGAHPAILTGRPRGSRGDKEPERQGVAPHPSPLPEGEGIGLPSPGERGTGDEGRTATPNQAPCLGIPPAPSPQLPCPDEPPVWRLVPRWGWTAYAAVERTAVAWRADLVHIQYQTGAYGLRPAINLLPWWLRRRRARPAVVTTFHDLRVPYLFPRAGRLRSAANAALARGSDLAIATNPADHAWLSRVARCAALIPIGPNIEPGPDTEAVAARLRAGLNLAPHELLLVTFGLLNHSKGLPTLLRALALLNDPAAVGKYRLALVGAGDAGLDPTDRTTAGEVKHLAAELGLTDALVWTGQRPAAEVAGWLRAADAVALPYVDGASYRRGTLLAALACGAAVVTTTPAADYADAPSVTSPPGAIAEAASLPRLRSGVHAMLVPPEDPAALATALAATAGDPRLGASLRRGALQIAAHFTWPTIAARTLAAYAAAMSNEQ